MKVERMQELVAATHTPFDKKGRLAVELVEGQAELLERNGIRSVFVTGSTGESHSLTVAERERMYEEWVEQAGVRKMRVVAHVGGNCLEDVCRLAASAESVGVAAISALAPSYYKPASVEVLVRFCERIAAAAPKTPFYFYHIPVLTGVNLCMESFLRLAAERVPTLMGIKFTQADLAAYRRCLELDAGWWDLPWGVDEMWLGALATGAKGGVGSTYNWAPELYRRVSAAFEAGDHEVARHWQSVSIAMIDRMAEVGFVGAAKALMARLGVPVGGVRLPLVGPSEEAFEGVWEALLELGWEDWGAKGLE